jgi:hypothetical protein
VRTSRLGKEKFSSRPCRNYWNILGHPISSQTWKKRRLVACVSFADAVRLSDIALSIILKDMFSRWHNALWSVEMGQIADPRQSQAEEDCVVYTKLYFWNHFKTCKHWFPFAADQLGEIVHFLEENDIYYHRTKYTPLPELISWSDRVPMEIRDDTDSTYPIYERQREAGDKNAPQGTPACPSGGKAGYDHQHFNTS